MKQKILIKLPSRGRPSKFFRALDSAVDNIVDRENFEILCTLDADDPTMNNEDVIAKVNLYPNTSISWGLSSSKIHAVNRDVPEDGWDIIVIQSDDIYFNLKGFDELIRQEMNTHFPEGDGYLHFNEKDSGSVLNVMTVVDKKYYDRFGYIYHPDYLSLWCDNEQFEVAKALKRYVYIPYSIMEHRNPAYNEYGEVKDEMFIRQQEIGWSVDAETFKIRQAINFELKQ